MWSALPKHFTSKKHFRESDLKMAAINVEELAGDILKALRAILAEDVPKLAELGVERSRRLAQMADMIAGQWNRGELSEEDRDWFLDDLARMSADFARTIALETLLTVERAWNAVAGVIWTALRAAIGVAGLPVPAIPLVV